MSISPNMGYSGGIIIVNIVDVPRDAIQQIQFNNPPTGGTFTITIFDSFISADIAYNASADDINTAFAANPTIQDNTTVNLLGGNASGGFTIEFTGALGGQPVTLVTVDASALSQPGTVTPPPGPNQTIAGSIGNPEVQTITLPAGTNGGNFSINSIGTAIPWNDDDSTIQTVIDGILTPGVATVSGGASPWTITWTANGPQSLFSLATIDLVGPPDLSDQPTTYQAGIADSGGSFATLVFSDPYGGDWATVFAGSEYSSFSFTIDSISYSYQPAPDTGNATFSATLASNGWTLSAASGGTFTITCNTKGSHSFVYGTLWIDVDDGMGDGGSTQTSYTDGSGATYTDGTPGSGGSGAVQALTLHGSTAGTFAITGDATTVSSISISVDNDTLTGNWQTATGQLITGVLGSGTDGDPWLISFTAHGPQDLPTVDGSSLIAPMGSPTTAEQTLGVVDVYEVQTLYTQTSDFDAANGGTFDLIPGEYLLQWTMGTNFTATIDGKPIAFSTDGNSESIQIILNDNSLNVVGTALGSMSVSLVFQDSAEHTVTISDVGDTDATVLGAVQTALPYNDSSIASHWSTCTGYTFTKTGTGVYADPWIFTASAPGPINTPSADFSGLTLTLFDISPIIMQTQAGHS